MWTLTRSCAFLASVGLAGELGASVTLVGEATIRQRGYGTILVATLGALGAVTAGLAGDFLPGDRPSSSRAWRVSCCSSCG